MNGTFRFGMTSLLAALLWVALPAHALPQQRSASASGATSLPSVRFEVPQLSLDTTRSAGSARPTVGPTAPQRKDATAPEDEPRGLASWLPWLRKRTPPPPDPPEEVIRVVRQQDPQTSDGAYGSPRLNTAFPNPASTEVKIEYNLGQSQTALLQIYDFLGKPVRSLMLRRGSTSIVLDVANLQPGIYFYSLEVDGKLVATKRLSISR